MAFKHPPTDAEAAQIADLYRAGHRFEEIRSRSGWCYATIKKVAAAQGLTRKKPRKAAPTSEINDAELLAFKAKWDKLDSTVKGTISENYAKTRLSELGFDVWEPVCQNHKTDLLLLDKRGVKRIQVKSGTYDPKTKCFRVNFTRRRRAGVRSDYDPEHVDYFIVHCAGIIGQLYVIPAGSVKNRSPRLFPHRPKLLAYRETEMERYLDAFGLLGPPPSG
jgi:hypothetical protein